MISVAERQSSKKENEPRDSRENYFVYENKQEYLEIPLSNFTLVTA